MDKASAFANKVSTAMLMPLILKGESPRLSLYTMCDYLLAVFDEVTETEKELDDSFVQVALEMSEVVRPVRALVTSDLDLVSVAMKELRFLARFSGKPGTSPACVVASAIRRSVWLQARMDDIMKNEASMTSAAASIAEHQAMLTTFAEEEPLRQLELVSEACQTLCKLQVALPEEFVKAFEAEVLSYSKQAASAMEAKLGGIMTDASQQVRVGPLLREMIIAFPHMEPFVDLEASLQKRFAEGRHEALLHSARLRCVTVAKLAKTCDDNLLTTGLADMLEAIRSVEGVKVPVDGEVHIAVREAAKACESAAWVVERLADGKALLNALEVLSKLVADNGELKAMAECLAAYFSLEESRCLYEVMVGTSIEESMSSGTFDMAILTAYRSHLRSMVALGYSGTHADEVSLAINKAKEHEKIAGDKLLEQSQKQLKSAYDDLLQKMAPARTTDGSTWRSQLPTTPTWKAYSTLASTTVALLKPSEVQAACQRVTQHMEQHKILADGFNVADSSGIAASSQKLVLEARSALVAGAVVALLATPLPDRVQQLRALQSQAKLAAAPDL